MVFTSMSLLLNLFLISYILHNKNQKSTVISPVNIIPQKRIRYSWQPSRQSNEKLTQKVTSNESELQPLNPPLEVNVIVHKNSCSNNDDTKSPFGGSQGLKSSS